MPGTWRTTSRSTRSGCGGSYSWLQTELRRRHPDLSVFVLNCTNGPGFGYLPPKSTYERDVYQVWQTEVRAGGLERLVDAVSEALE